MGTKIVNKRKKTVRTTDDELPQQVEKQIVDRVKTDYFNTRIFDEMGLSPAECHTRPDEPENSAEYLYPDDRGDICIDLYTIEGDLIQYDKGTSKYKQRNAPFTVRRLHPERVKGDRKYLFPKGQGTNPFFGPGLLKAYREKVKLPYLAFTEGYLKAIKADTCGIPMVGLGSITHLKTGGEMYWGVKELIKVCQPEYLIMVYDADCVAVYPSYLEEEKDLYRRPNLFYRSAEIWQQMLKYADKSMYVKPITHGLQFDPEQPKGIDDLLIANPDHVDDIAKELAHVSKEGPGKYFHTINITFTAAKWARHLAITGPEDFYMRHSQEIGEAAFTYNGSRYQWLPANDDRKSPELKLLVPGEAKDYFRVGTQYFKWITKPNAYGGENRVFEAWDKTTIMTDHNKDFLKHVLKLESFVNIPDHTNWQLIHRNCMNLYQPFKWEPDKGNCDVSLAFMEHIFGEQIEFGLDYVQLLYQRPTEKLPILCLVSEENATGKGTFLNWLKEIFGLNMSIIGNAELTEQFNSTYADKLLCGIDEGFINKKEIVEKLKKLSTDRTIQLRRMNKDHQEIDFFCKFIILSNNVRNFVNATDKDIRYWVRYVKPPEKENPNILDDLIEEIPAFLHYLQKRTLSNPEKQSRMWFNPQDLVTDALRRLQAAGRSWAEKHIIEHVISAFETLPISELSMSLGYAQDVIFRGHPRHADSDYLLECLSKIGQKSDGKSRKGVYYVDGQVVEKWKPRNAVSRYEVTRDRYTELVAQRGDTPMSKASPSEVIYEAILGAMKADNECPFEKDLLREPKTTEQLEQPSIVVDDVDDCPF